MPGRLKPMLLAAGLICAFVSFESAFAESPFSRVRAAADKQHYRVLHVQRHRPAHNYRYYRPRAGSRGYYRVARPHVHRIQPRLRRGHYRYRHGAHVYRGRHRHRRGVDAGAVVAGLIIGGLVYELLDGDSDDDGYYRYACYEDH